MMNVIRTFLCVWCLLVISCAEVAADKGGPKAEALLRKRQWKEAEALYTKRLIAFAEAPGPKKNEALVQLVLCYDIARYFDQAAPEDVTYLGDFLMSNTDFTTTLLRAFKPEDSPRQAFHVLTQIKRKFGEDDLLRYPGLAIAHALVWDSERPPSNRFEAVDSFDFYVSNVGRMLDDIAALPYQAALFLACAEATPAERVWAQGKIMRLEDMSKLYNSLEYDWGGAYGGRKRIAGHPYTLPNLLRYGGICGDRAYYAANVVRAAGVPAVWIAGVGLHGGHAWTGYLKSMEGGQFVWYLGCGRYESERYYVGITFDPQTGRQIYDYQVPMRTKECTLPPERVRASNAWVCLAEVCEREKRQELVKNCVEAALTNNRFNLSAWNHVMRMIKTGTLGPEYGDQIIAEALKTFPDEPDFCYGLYTALLEQVPRDDFAHRARLYKQGVGFFKARPDLTVALAQAYGDYLLESEKREEAYAVYHETIRTYMDDQRLVVDMAVKVTNAQTASDDLDKSATLMKTMIGRAKKPPYNHPVAKFSTWYQLNLCLKGVYEKMGKQDEADKIAAELGKFKRH